MKKIIGNIGEIILYVLLFGVSLFLLKLRFAELTSF